MANRAVWVDGPQTANLCYNVSDMKALRRIFSTALLLPASLVAADIRSARALNEFRLGAPTNDLSFSLTGVVTRTGMNVNSPMVFVADRTGNTAFYCNTNTVPPAQGDVIAVDGVAIVCRDLYPWIVAKRIRTLGKSAVPDPEHITIKQMLSGRYDFKDVVVEGDVFDIVDDDVQADCPHILIHSGQDTTTLFLAGQCVRKENLLHLLNAHVSISGYCRPRSGHWRTFQGYGIYAPTNNITVIRSAPEDPFDVPDLKGDLFSEASLVFGFDRRRTTGTVLAAWNGNRLLLATEHRRFVEVAIQKNHPLPSCGQVIQVVGFPGTNLFSMDFANAIWRPASGEPFKPADPHVISASDLMPTNGEHRFMAKNHGGVIRMLGLVRGVSSVNREEAKVYIESDGRVLPIDVSACAEVAKSVEIGSILEATGICYMETDSWKPNAPLPRIKGFTIIVRSPEDVRVLARPPWWTPTRLLVVIGSLLAALLGILVWNRILNRLVERRSRQLFREQVAHAGDKLKVGERTRLAVELHDSLSQTLTGVSFQIDAAERARTKDPSRIAKHLAIAKRTLTSCREELRNCLWDLRNNALEDADAADAIRRTIEPHIAEAAATIDFDVPRAKLSDNTFHAVLCIIRELAVNAVRHGAAQHIAIRGELADGHLACSVTDDGTGFDPGNRPGMDEGHFGLLGISERINTLGGTLQIDSAKGHGATVRFTIST